jgi:hypothetical protein
MSCLLLILGILPGATLAEPTVLSGLFEGSESSTMPLPGTCGGNHALRYQLVKDLQVTVDGSYTISDAYQFIGVDISALVYEENFNPDAPQSKLLTPNGIDIRGEVNLSAGVVYVVVIQHWCQNREGAWAVGISGPGAVTSSHAVILPEHLMGSFSGNDPVTDSDCGNSQYRQWGPFRVPDSGTYYYSDMSIHFALDICLQIYTMPFDPGDPDANRIGEAMDDFGAFELEAGKDYYAITQPWKSSQNGEFFYLIAPPAPFRISKALAGSWYYPPTSGQGFFIDVFDDINQVFLAWFTYDLERPDESTAFLIGDSGHRWMTASGSFDGDTANLNISWASGMVFDSATPPVSQTSDGTMTVKFTSCTEGLVDYDLGSANVVGQVPIESLAEDHVDLCESLIKGPGQPAALLEEVR